MSNTNVDTGHSLIKEGKRKQRRLVTNKNVNNPTFRRLDDNTEGINLISPLPLKSSNAVPVISRRARFTAEAKGGVHHDLGLCSEDDDTYVYEHTTLSDFIDDDSLFLGEHELDSDMATVTPQQKRTRKLVRGRRPDREQLSEVEDREQEQSRTPAGTNITQPITSLQNESRHLMLNLVDCSNNGGVIRNGKCLMEPSDRATSSGVNELFLIPNL
jgi:hypothetical protein